MTFSPEPDNPIGIFDSGVGGLTVLAALKKRLPGESFVYLGDTARVPYGNKSPEVVTRYAFENTLFLLDRGVKMVVIACNTATAGSLDRLQRHFRRPIVGVIEPGAAHAARTSASGVIGVIGTVGTIASGAYEQAIRQHRPSATVYSAACPLLVPLAEEGWLDHPASKLVVGEYLSPLLRYGIDVLLLGCTHYPLLRGLITERAGSGVEILDSALATAEVVAEQLQQLGLERQGPGGGQVEFFLSDRHPHFKRLGERFLDAPIGEIHLVTY
jgi:glutamate racemase